MKNLDTIWSDINDLLKQWEQAVENTLDTEIDIFTESKEQIDAANKKAVEKAQTKAHKATIDVKKDVVKTNILNQLTKWYNNAIEKINSLPNLGSAKQETLDELKNEYSSIKNIIEWYNNDWEFKKWFSLVNDKITKWINKLNSNKSDSLANLVAWDIIDSSIHSLSILKADLAILNWATKESIEKSKTQLSSQFENNAGWTEEATSMLTKIWIPAWVAGIMAGLWKSMWFFGSSKSWEKWIFSKFMDILKNPGKFFMWLFGFWSNESTSNTTIPKVVTENNTTNNKSSTERISGTEVVAVNSQLLDTEYWQKYIHNNISLETNKWSFSEILVWNSKYKININNQPDLWLWDISFEKRNNDDILKVWDTEIELLAVVTGINPEQPKDQYTLKEDFRLMWDLVLEKVA